MNLRNVSIGLSSLVLLGIVAFLIYSALGEGFFTLSTFALLLFLMLSSGFPPMVSIVLSACTKSPFSQVILAVTSLLYGVWYAYLVNEILYVSPEPSAIVFLVVGFFALPVLLPLWLIAIVIERRHRKKQAALPPLS
jgi:hypothetical protein